MHLLAPFLTALTLLLTFTTAKQSRPFFLVLQSSNTTLNGRTLFAGHEGAAIEGLFLGPKLAKTKPEYATFHFNTTKGDTSGEGLLTWVLEGSNFNESEAMQISPDLSSNVAIALFTPSEGDGTYVHFSKSGEMYILSYLTDTVSPPIETAKPAHLKRWYMCVQNYGGYVYEVLSWVYGVAEPENPSCQKVKVQRVFKGASATTKKGRRGEVCERADGSVGLC